MERMFESCVTLERSFAQPPFSTTAPSRLVGNDNSVIGTIYMSPMILHITNVEDYCTPLVSISFYLSDSTALRSRFSMVQLLPLLHTDSYASSTS